MTLQADTVGPLGTCELRISRTVVPPSGISDIPKVAPRENAPDKLIALAREADAHSDISLGNRDVQEQWVYWSGTLGAGVRERAQPGALRRIAISI